MGKKFSILFICLCFFKSLIHSDTQNIKQKEEMRLESDLLFFLGKKQFEKTMEIFEKCLSIYPEHKESKEYLEGMKSFLMMRMAKEIELKSKEKVNNQRIKFYLKKGKEFYDKKEWEKSMGCFEELLRFQPNNQEAINYLTEIKKILADNYFREGLKLYNRNYFVTAIIWFEKALKIDPLHNDSRTHLIKSNENIKKLKIMQSEKYYIQGMEKYKAGDIREAAELWKKAIELNPKNTKCLNALRRVLYE